MSSEAFPTKGANEFLPPSTSGTASSVTTSAANIDLSVSKGGRFITFQPRGGDAYVRFKSTNAAAGTTSGNSSNGYKIADGTTVSFWVSPASRYCDCIGSAALTLFWWNSSPNYQDQLGGGL